MKTTLAKDKKFSGFIQTSDIHIGESRNYDGYLERHRKVLWDILDLAQKKKKPLLIPGDIFHRNDTRHEERRLAYEWICEMEDRKIYSIITAGNHDHIEGTSTQLDPLLKFPFKYVKIVAWEPEVIELGNLGIIALSWQDYTEVEIKELVDRLYPLIADKEFKVVMVHEFVYGSMMDNGKIIAKGMKLPTTLPMIDYWAMGDIHKCQPATLPNAWYAGSPLQFKFDDVLEKGVLDVALPFAGRPEFIRTKFKPFITVDSVEKMTEEAYYCLKSDDAKALVQASTDSRVVRTDWVKREAGSINISDIPITDGLADFLASKGISEKLQERALKFVAEVTKRSVV